MYAKTVAVEVLNVKINRSVTNDSNKNPTRRQRHFLIKARMKCKEKGRFCCADFPELSAGNFRQMIHRLRDSIELDYRSNPCFYRLKKMTPEDIATVTEKPTGDGMIHILRSLKEQPPKIHDIKLKFNYPLHSKLVRDGLQPNPANHGIPLNDLRIPPGFITKIMVYPNTVQVDLGCTNNPLVYDIAGVVKITLFLGQLYQMLYLYAYYDEHLPLPGKWIVTHYHFGKDGSEVYSGQLYHKTFENVATGLIRFYSKTFSDGKTVPRIEQIQSPNNTLDEEIEKMIEHEIIKEHLIEEENELENIPAQEGSN